MECNLLVRKIMNCHPSDTWQVNNAPPLPNLLVKLFKRKKEVAERRRQMPCSALINKCLLLLPSSFFLTENSVKTK